MSESDMNTFVTLTDEMSSTDIKEIMELIEKIERSANALQVVWSDSLADGNFDLQLRCRGYIEKFSGKIFEKLDCVAAHLLRFVDNHMNDKFEIDIEEFAGKVSMGMWASFNENRPIRKSIQFEQIGMQLDIPKQILNQDARFVHRVIRMPIDTLSLTAYELSSSMSESVSSKLSLGDLIQIDILLPPPQAFMLRAKKWKIRDKSAMVFAVTRSPYPSSVACRCYFKVPAEVVMADDVRVALWDEETRSWTEEGLNDYQYSDSTRMAQFYISTVGVVALVRDRVREMPYKSWSLKAIRSTKDEIGGTGDDFEDGGKFSERRARFTLSTQNHELVIDIIGTSCKLISPERSEFFDLIGANMSPGVLLTKLQRRGVNLLPTTSDLTLVEDIIPKVRNKFGRFYYLGL